MDNLSIKDLFKLIPFDDEMRNYLLTNFDSFEESLKFEIRKVCWDIFIEMTEKLADIKYQALLLEVEEGKRQLTGDLMQIADEAVHQDYRDILSGKKKEVEQIEEIRTKLKTLSEIIPQQR